MDPNATLRTIRRLAKLLVAGEAENATEIGGDLGELVQSLDIWLTTGGMLPDAWERKDKKVPRG